MDFGFTLKPDHDIETLHRATGGLRVHRHPGPQSSARRRLIRACPSERFVAEAFVPMMRAESFHEMELELTPHGAGSIPVARSATQIRARDGTTNGFERPSALACARWPAYACL
jgi:hypothetical protein